MHRLADGALQQPNYYRNVPGQVPNFVKTLFRRKLVIWYMAAEILRDYWLYVMNLKHHLVIDSMLTHTTYSSQIRSLWQKLVFPMDWIVHACLGNCHIGLHLFHRSLGCKFCPFLFHPVMYVERPGV